MFTCIVKILIKKKKKSINAISNFKPIQRESTSLINASYSLYPQTLRLKKKKKLIERKAGNIISEIIATC